MKNLKFTFILLFTAFLTLPVLSQVQNALDFDGIDDWVNVAAVPLQTTVNNFTMECWVWPTNTISVKPEQNGLTDVTGTAGNGQRYAIGPQHGGGSGGAPGDAGAGISIGTNGIQVYEHKASYMPCLLSYMATLPAGWNHIAVVYINKQPRLYLNGVLVRTGLTSLQNNVFPSGLLGSFNVYGFYQGSIDEVRVWNYSKTQNEIQAEMYREFGNISDPTLKLYFKFNQTSGTTVTNLSSTSGLNGNMVSMDPATDWVVSTAPIPYFSIADGNWNVNGTWASGQRVPANTWSRVRIKNAVTATASATVEGFNIFAGSSFTINPGVFFTVNGPFVNNGGTGGLVIKADGTGRGSLIHGISGINGTMETYITPNVWHFVSSPVSGAVSGIFTTYYLQKHNETTNLYSDVTSVTSPLNLMQGYALYTGISNTFSYTGNFNTGAQSFGLTRNNSGWNLTGNPYPSSIDWDAASGWTKTNVNNAVYVENNGGWATYNSGVGTNGGSRYIAPGQGFFVECSTHPGNLAMTDAVRVHNNAAFFKNEVSNLVRIEATGSEMNDETVIRFDEAASVDFDGMLDAYKLPATGNISEIYSFAGSRELSINALPSVQSVLLGFRAPNSGTYSIAATEVLDIANVILEDKLTGEFTDLQMTNYPFVYTTGEDADRFVLHFTPMSVENTTEEFIHVYAYGKMVYLNLKADQKAEVRIFNLLGQEVKSMAVSSETSSISLEQSGIYLVKVSTADRSTTVKVNIE